MRTEWQTQPRTRWIVAVGAIAYAISLSTFSILAHRGLKTQMNDLGNMDQAIWAAAQGDLAMTQSNDWDGRLRSRIGVHANLIFWLLAPMYLIWPDPEALLILTSIACAVAGIGLYAFARQRLGESWWTVVPPLAFWLSPIVHDANLYDFHVITITTALLVWTVWAFDADHRRSAWVLLALALLCKEDVALITFMLGVYMILSGSRRRGFLVSGLSLAYFVLVLEVIIPAFNDGRGLERLEADVSRYRWLGFGLGDIVKTLVTQPGLVLEHVSRPDRLRIPVYFLICGAIVAFPGWRMLLLLASPIAMSVLSEASWMTRVTGTYYWITSEAIIIMACILAEERRRGELDSILPRPLAYLGCVTLILSILLSPLPHGAWSTLDDYKPSPDRRTLTEIANMIPKSASVCVQNNLGPHLSQRRDIAAHPRRLESADYALFHVRYAGGPDAGLFDRTPYTLFGMDPRQMPATVRDLIASPDWGLIAQKDSCYLLARGQSPKISESDALSRLLADADALETRVEQAAKSRSPWSRHLVRGQRSW